METRPLHAPAFGCKRHGRWGQPCEINVSSFEYLHTSKLKIPWQQWAPGCALCVSERITLTGHSGNFLAAGPSDVQFYLMMF